MKTKIIMILCMMWFCSFGQESYKVTATSIENDQIIYMMYYEKITVPQDRKSRSSIYDNRSTEQKLADYRKADDMLKRLDSLEKIKQDSVTDMVTYSFTDYAKDHPNSECWKAQNNYKYDESKMRKELNDFILKNPKKATAKRPKDLTTKAPTFSINLFEYY